MPCSKSLLVKFYLNLRLIYSMELTVLVIAHIYVTGSEKRYIVAHIMIFLYKRCCSKTRNAFYSLKKIFFWLRYLQLFAYTHAKFEELNVLLTGQARCLKRLLKPSFTL